MIYYSSRLFKTFEKRIEKVLDKQLTSVKIINVVTDRLNRLHGRPLKTEYSFDEHKCAGSSIITIDAKTFAKSIRLI